MPKYIVNSPIEHNGEKHMPGDDVEMDAKNAKPLLERGDIKAASESKGASISLLGSSALPAQIELAKGKTVPLGNVVQAAFKKSGLSTEEWNALAEDVREAKLAETVEAMKAGKT